MQWRLSEPQERPFAPWALCLAGWIVGILLFDAVYWLETGQQASGLAHPLWYGGALALASLWLAWACRSRSLRIAWLMLALNEVALVLASYHAAWIPWWLRDALPLASAASMISWAWRPSPHWSRFVAIAMFLL